MAQLNSLHGTVFRRVIIAVAALAMIGCGQRAAPKVGDELPPPNPSYQAPRPYQNPNPTPGYQPPAYPAPQTYQRPQTYQGQQAGPQDAVLRGAAYLRAGGSAQVPPGSRMIVRVYDAQGGDVNSPRAERNFTSNGQGLPWAYELRVPLETLRTLSKPAVAARIEDPNGRPLYLNNEAVVLTEGSADDIPMIAANGAGGYSSVPGNSYTDYGRSPQRAQPAYGIPEDTGYGAPSYDVPTYSGQSYGSPSLSAPPLNAPGVI